MEGLLLPVLLALGLVLQTCVGNSSSLMVDSPSMRSSSHYHYIYGEERCALHAGARVCCFGTQCPLRRNSMGNGERYGVFEPFAPSNGKELTGSIMQMIAVPIVTYLLTQGYKLVKRVWNSVKTVWNSIKNWVTSKQRTRVELLCHKLIPHLGIRHLQGYYGDVERQILFIHVDSGYRKAKSYREIVKDQVIGICQKNEIDLSGCKFKYVQQNSKMKWQYGLIPSGGAIAKYSHDTLNLWLSPSIRTVVGINGITYGTMTGMFEDPVGNVYALTAAHVLKGVNFNRRLEEENIECVCDMQQANGDSQILPISGPVSSIRGYHPLGRENVFMDVSAVRVTLPPDTHPEYIGLPAGTTRPSIATNQYLNGTKVQKNGAASGLTLGTIVEDDYYVNIDGQIYSGMMLVRSDNPHHAFTEGGDSGALVTGVDGDPYAYGINVSILMDFVLEGHGTFNASMICRLDKTLAVLNDKYNFNLDFKHANR